MAVVLSAGLRQPTLSFQLSYASNPCAVPLDPGQDFQTDRASFQVTVANIVERLVLSTCQALLPSVRWDPVSFHILTLVEMSAGR